MERLTAISVAPNWEILWNKLYDLDPDKIEEYNDAWLYVFVEDMILMQTSYTYKRNKKLIKHTLVMDLGWYPEGDKNGTYHLYAILDDDWNSPILECKTRSIQEVVETMEMWMFEKFQRFSWAGISAIQR
ncbi:MAG: hypothetical protein HFJ09_07990 [Lachnospiraceae bacterium]|nr:hypothetical protein [Lachnospiraceae bacterium]